MKFYTLKLFGILNGQSVLISETSVYQGKIIELNTLPKTYEEYAVKDNLWYSDANCTSVISENFTINKNKRIYCNLTTVQAFDFEYTGDVQLMSLGVGAYILECWGAQGGQGCDGTSASMLAGTPGKGGYSVEIIQLSTPSTAYIYVGGRGGNVTLSTPGTGGFNGGANGSRGNRNGSMSGGGGGASDIRIEHDSLYARVIVAGGGGSTS